MAAAGRGGAGVLFDGRGRAAFDGTRTSFCPSIIQQFTNILYLVTKYVIINHYAKYYEFMTYLLDLVESMKNHILIAIACQFSVIFQV